MSIVHKGINMKGMYAIFLLSIVTVASAENGCAARMYGFDSVVCVCNLTYCDQLPLCEQMEPGTVQVFETNKKGSRFERQVLSLRASDEEYPHTFDYVTIIVNSTAQFQSILGFGGAFTDAAGININSLPPKMQNDVIESYFSEFGSEYSVARIPMASTDFSTYEYSYDDVEGDFQLRNFSLRSEDFNYKIPYILRAKQLAKQELYLFGSPWSAPSWMKTNRKMSGGTFLIQEEPYFSSWAHYFVKFIEGYKDNGIDIWGVTVENEPEAGLVPFYPWQSMGYTAGMERDFVAQYLGPVLEEAGYGPDKLKIMIVDGQRLSLPYRPDVILADERCQRYVSGIAFHWYNNIIAPVFLLDMTKERHPDKFILMSEACIEKQFMQNAVRLGFWKGGEAYAKDIIEVLQHSTSGWVDWNLALDEEGGPNHAKNFVDSPIIVNATGQEFYKQPMYYVLAHFSKLLPRHSKKIESSGPSIFDFLDIVAFQRPDKGIVLHILNRGLTTKKIRVKTDDGSFVDDSIPASSLKSYVWWPEQ